MTHDTWRDFSEINFDPECGRVYELSPFQDLCVDILYWARNKRWGIQNHTKHNFHPGPSGRRERQKPHFWWPEPSECCDTGLHHWSEIETVEKDSYKTAFDPWVWWKHCKSREHIVYLIRHRMSMIVRGHFWNTHMFKFIKVVRDGVPLYVNDPDPVILEFVRDVLSGYNWDVKKYFGD